MEQPAPRPRPHSIPLLQILTALVLMALGFLVVIQSRAGRALVAQPEVPTRNVYALATLLREEREAHVALEAEVAELRNRLEVYERAAAEGQSLTAAMSKELETLRAAVDLQRLQGPFVITAIGDPATLEGALNIKGGLVEALRTIGLGLSIAGHDRVQVSAASGPVKFEHARPFK